VPFVVKSAYCLTRLFVDLPSQLCENPPRNGLDAGVCLHGQLGLNDHNTPESPTRMMKDGVWVLAALLAAVAGWMDWRSRRIPNWLTMSGVIVGIGANSLAWGWRGTKDALLGAGLGLALLLPLVLIRSLGGGDWKLAGAVGAFMGPQHLISALIFSALVAGFMAVVLIIWKRRVMQTLRNIGHMLGAFATLHLPGSEITIDNPESLKVPFGIAMAFAVILYSAAQLWRIS
jgi:prepilin peptidase CpaA